MVETISSKPADAVVPRRNPSFIWRKIEFEVILFNPTNNETYKLNHTGSTIWELCDGAHSVEDIASAITDKYETEKEKIDILQDIAIFIKEGEKSGYLTTSD